MAAAAWLPALISGLFGFGGAALQGDPGQKRQSFAGSAVDPKLMLTEFMGNLNQMGAGAADRLRKPTRLRTVAQAPKGFAQDPAAIDPSLLERPGLDLETMFRKFSRPTGEGAGGGMDLNERKRERANGGIPRF